MAAIAYAQHEEFSTGCTVLKLSKTLFSDVNAISSSGRYCLNRDTTVPLVRDWHAGGGEKYFGGGVYDYITINTSKTTLNFNGHTVKVKPFGIIGVLCSDGNFKCTDVTIQNGKIATNSGIGILMQYPGRNYLVTNNVIENMHIIVSNKGNNVSGIAAAGGGIVVRNNIIEVEADKDAWNKVIDLAGSGALIENNLIIFKGPVGKSVYPVSEEEKREYALDSAPIVLADGDGTIIRNNDIVIQRGLLGTPPKYAIGLFRSKDVVLENNRIYGADVLYKAFDEKSSVVDKGGNEFRSIFRRPWSHPKANAQ